MSLLTTTDLGHAFGDLELFRDVNVQITRKDRIALVGPNGAGKTTLLLILAGQLEPTSGTLAVQRDLTLGYLHQEAVLTFANRDHTVYQEMLTVFADLRQVEEQLQHLEGQMAAGLADETLLAEYGRLQAHYEHGGGYDYHVEIKRVLQGLGFAAAEWKAPLSHLSGGQKTRVLLGRLLLEKPDLLILDEPTNHLDVTAVEWLERTLHTWPGTLLLVSHDRYFLDRVADQVWDLSRHGLRTYRGNYTAYVRQRQEAWEREQALFHSEKERLTQELLYIQKHIADGQTDMAKGKLRRLTRDLTLIEQVGVVAMQGKSWLQLGERLRPFSVNEAMQHLRDLKAPDDRPPRLNMRLHIPERSDRVVLRGKKLQVGYGTRPLFGSEKLTLERRDCAALIGPNGSGKTTFLRTLLGEIRPLTGSLHWGDNVRLGYFAQGHDQLNLTRRLIDELRAHADIELPAARRHLAQYLFRGDDVFKKVGDLSGGERGRLALAILSLAGANALLLDEPTNHLDIPSQEVLQEVLETFDGAIVLASHDRYLVNRLATQIWELRDGHLYSFLGTYAEFLAARTGEGQPSTSDVHRLATPPETRGRKTLLPETPPETKLRPPDVSWVAEIVPPPPPAKPKKKSGRSLQARLGELDEALAETEAWLAELTDQLALAQAEGDDERLSRLTQEHAATQAQLGALQTEWDRLMGES